VSDPNAPVALYIAAYSDDEAAQRDWDAIKQLEDDDVIDLDGLLLVARDADGKVDVKDNAATTKKGGIIGAVAGAVIGLIFPPSLLGGALVGGGIGAGVGALKSHSDRNDIKEDVEDVLPPGSSGIVALFSITWEPQVEKALADADKVTKHSVDAGSADEVKEAAATS
jgi:uncharacterized membrane protein